MIKVITFFIMLLGLSVSELHGFCGKVVAVSGSSHKELSDVSSITLFDEDLTDLTSTPYNEKYLRVTDWKTIHVVALSTNLHLGSFIDKDQLIASENVKACIDRCSFYTRTYRNQTYRYAKNVKALKTYLNDKQLVSGAPESLFDTLGSDILNLSIHLKDFSEGTEDYLSDDPEWKKTNDDSGYEFQKDLTVQANRLPFSFTSGNFSFSITENLLALLHFSYGDADYFVGADTLLYAADKESKLKILDLPYLVRLSGGDNVSGLWSAEGQVQIKVTNPYSLLRRADSPPYLL